MSYRIAHFADFHLRNAGKDLERALALVADAVGPEVSADHIVVAGDIVDLANIKLVTRFVTGLKGIGLSGPARLTIVPGNHDIFPVSKRPPWLSIGNL